MLKTTNKNSDNKILINYVFGTNTKLVYQNDATRQSLGLNTVVMSNNKNWFTMVSNNPYRYNVSNSLYLSRDNVYNVLTLEEETNALHIYLQGNVSINGKKSNMFGLSNITSTKIAIAKSNNRIKALNVVLNSMIPYIVRELKRFFNVKLSQINKIDDYISDCKELIIKALNNSKRIKMGVPLYYQLYNDIKSQIRSTYGEIGGNFTLSGYDVLKRTKIYNVRKANPNITNEEIAEMFGYKVGTKCYENFLSKIEWYDTWQASAIYCERENDYYPSFDNVSANTNDIDEKIENDAKNESIRQILLHVKSNFNESYYSIYITYYKLYKKLGKKPSYEVIGKKFNYTKANISYILNKIDKSIKNAINEGIIKSYF